MSMGVPCSSTKNEEHVRGVSRQSAPTRKAHIILLRASKVGLRGQGANQLFRQHAYMHTYVCLFVFGPFVFWTGGLPDSTMSCTHTQFENKFPAQFLLDNSLVCGERYHTRTTRPSTAVSRLFSVRDGGGTAVEHNRLGKAIFFPGVIYYLPFPNGY